jgi:hypothetical protein
MKNIILRKVIVEILKEEIGRNYQTINNDPFSWKEYDGIHVEIYPAEKTKVWFAKVTADFNDKYSTPLRKFNSEDDAENFARQHAEIAHRAYMNSSIQV